MNSLLILIPAALVLGGIGLAAFLWAMHTGQFSDLEGAAGRILFDDDPPKTRNVQSRKISRKGEPQMNIATIVVAVFAAILGLVGLFMASRATDTGIYLFGLTIFAFSIILNFQFIKRHFDEAERE